MSSRVSMKCLSVHVVTTPGSRRLTEVSGPRGVPRVTSVRALPAAPLPVSRTAFGSPNIPAPIGAYTNASPYRDCASSSGR